MMRAFEVQQLQAGDDCWDPSSGRMGTSIIVRWDVDDRVERIPFTDETYALASSGAFWTLRTCA